MEDEEKKIVLLVNFVQSFLFEHYKQFVFFCFRFFSIFNDKLNNMCSLFEIQIILATGDFRNITSDRIYI